MRRQPRDFVQKNFSELVLADDLFEQVNVASEGFAPGLGKRAGGERAVVLVGLGHGNKTFLLQDADVRGEIAVGHVQRVAQLGKGKLCRGRECGHDGEPPLLVDDAVELKEQFGIHATGFFLSVK